MDYGTEPAIDLEYKGRYALLTINKPQKAGALSRMQYYELGQKLREVATHDEVYVTILVGKGHFFSAYDSLNLSRTGCTLLLIIMAVVSILALLAQSLQRKTLIISAKRF
jgi:hypothetical protein